MGETSPEESFKKASWMQKIEEGELFYVTQNIDENSNQCFI